MSDILIVRKTERSIKTIAVIPIFFVRTEKSDAISVLFLLKKAYFSATKKCIILRKYIAKSLFLCYYEIKEEKRGMLFLCAENFIAQMNITL